MNDFSRILIHFDGSAHDVEELLETVRGMGAEVIGVDILPSDKPGHRIASLEVANEDVSAIAVRLIEEESLEAVGLSASAARVSRRGISKRDITREQHHQNTKEE